MRHKDHSPVPHTCPLIDDVIYFLEHDVSNAGEVSLTEIKNMVVILEKIRSANSTLRSWGNKQCEDFSEAQDEIDYLKGENKRLESDNDDYQNQIKSLEKQIEELETTH